jgi:DNA polymerase-3 subunit beta
MKFSIDKSTLLSALDMAHKAISSKSSLPILEGFLIEAEKDTLTITGHDLEIGIRCEIQTEIIKPGSIVVNATLFSGVIKNMPDTDIDICLNDSELLVEAGNSNAKIKTIPAKGYPSLPSAKGGQVLEIDQQVLKDLISKTVFAVSLDENRPILTGELVECKDGQITVVAIDGFRMALARDTMKNEMPFRAVIQSKALSEIAKIMRTGKIRIFANSNAIMFEGDNFILTGRVIEGEYLNYAGIVPNEFVTTAIAKTSDFKGALETIKPFMPSESDRRTPAKFIIKDDLIIDYVSDTGEAHNKISADIAGDSFEISFNPRYFTEAFKNISDEKIKFQFSGPLGPCVIKPVEGDGFLYLVLPIRK